MAFPQLSSWRGARWHEERPVTGDIAGVRGTVQPADAAVDDERAVEAADDVTRSGDVDLAGSRDLADSRDLAGAHDLADARELAGHDLGDHLDEPSDAVVLPFPGAG